MIPAGPQSNSRDTHYVVEKHFWALHCDYIQKGTEHKILTAKNKVVLDTSTSLIHGPKEVISPLISGITVAEDCSNLATLPELHFAIDGMPYTLAG